MTIITKVFICFIVPVLYIIVMKLIRLDVNKYPHLVYLSFVIAMILQGIVISYF
jgi:hypothetical protein